MKPQLKDDESSQYKEILERLRRLEGSSTGYTGEIWTSGLKYTSGPPAGSLKCDGQALPAGVAETASLRAALIADGSPHGTSSGNPKVPNFNDRIPIGAGGTRLAGVTGGSTVGIITNAIVGTDGTVAVAAGGDHDVKHHINGYADLPIMPPTLAVTFLIRT